MDSLLYGIGLSMGGIVAITISAMVLVWWWKRASTPPPLTHATPLVAPTPVARAAAMPIRNWKPVAIFVLVALVLVAVALVLYWFVNPSTKILDTMAPYIPDIMAIFILGALAIWGLSALVASFGVLAATGARASKSAKSWKLFVTFMAFVFLEVVLYTSAPWAAPMFRGGGLWHLLIYPLGILILAAATDLTGNKLVPVILAVVAFAILGISHLPEDWKRDNFPSFLGGSSTRQAASAGNAQCPGNWTLADLTTTRATEINREGFCKTRIKHPGKCIYLMRPTWTNDKKWYGPYCDTGDGKTQVAPDYVQWAVSADGPFKALVQLNP